MHACKLNGAKRVRFSSHVSYTRDGQVSVSFSRYGLMTFRYSNRDVVRSKAGNTSRCRRRRFPTVRDEDAFYVKLEKRDTVDIACGPLRRRSSQWKTRIMDNLSHVRDLYHKLEFARSPWPVYARVGLSGSLYARAKIPDHNFAIRDPIRRRGKIDGNGCRLADTRYYIDERRYTLRVNVRADFFPRLSGELRDSKS